MWDILLATEEETKWLTGNILVTKAVRLQTVYMGTCKTRISLHGVPLDLTEDHLGTSFMKYGKVGKVSPVLSISGFFTGKFTPKEFLDILNILTCRGWSIYIIVEG